MSALKRFLPLVDRVLVARAEAATKSKGGILIPEKAQAKMKEGTIVAVGPGARNTTDGKVMPMSLAVGDKVLLPEFGGLKVEIDDKEFSLFKENDILAKLAKE